MLFTRPASNATLSGYVYDSSTELPLEGVTVDFYTTSATTDASGFYSLNLNPGTYGFTASKTGYSDYTWTVTLQSGTNTMDLDIARDADLLFLDLENNHNLPYFHFIRSAVENLGYTQATVVGFDGMVLENYATVFVLGGITGEDVEIWPGSDEEQALIDCINNGGNLILDGSSLYTLPGRPDNLFALLDVNVIDSDGEADIGAFGGDTPFNLMGFDLYDLDYTVGLIEPTNLALRPHRNLQLPAGVPNGLSVLSSSGTGAYNFFGIATRTANMYPRPSNPGWEPFFQAIFDYWDNPTSQTLVGNRDYLDDGNHGPWLPDGDVWQYGNPIAGDGDFPGPGGSYTGENAHAVNLAGTHGATEDATLWSYHSFWIDIPWMGNGPQLRYYHWYDYAAEDGYQVVVMPYDDDTITPLVPEHGYSGHADSFGADVWNNEGDGSGEGQWAPVVYDLSAFANDNVKIGFRHMASAADTSHWGVAIDDIQYLPYAVPYSVSGTITETNSNLPLAGATVQLADQTITTDGNGWYSFEEVGFTGSYPVTGSLDGYFTLETEVDIELANVEHNMELAPFPSASLSGEVRMATLDVPIEGATVTIGDSVRVTDDDGLFSFDGLYEYWTPLVVDHPGFDPISIDVDLSDGNNTAYVAIDPPPFFVDMSPVAGEIVEPDGGSVIYDVYLANSTGQVQQGDVWMSVLLPNGNLYGPIWSLDSYYFLPGFAFGNDMAISIPAMAPAGDYVASIFAGSRPNVVLAEDGLPFQKLAAPRETAGDMIGRPSGDAPVFEGTMITGEGGSMLPDEFALEAIYPNPFNPTTKIRIALPEAAELTVDIYNIIGQRVAELVRGQTAAGWRTVVFDGTNLASGVYFVRVDVPGELSELRKVVLVR